jgi:formylglycine-generating enzyme required for sulfatase activity
MQHSPIVFVEVESLEASRQPTLGHGAYARNQKDHMKSRGLLKLQFFASITIVAACGYPELGGSDGGTDTPIDDTQKDAPLAPVATSCQGLSLTCGPNGNEDCCASLTIPGGSFYRGFDVAGDSSSGNQNFTATVGSYRLDKYEVTVGRFRAFVLTGKSTQADPPIVGDGAHANIVGSGWDSRWNQNLANDRTALTASLKCRDATLYTWTDSPGDNESRPINCISWYAAMAFCAWDGGFLPTEAEWHYVASGGSEQRAFPWSTPAGSLAVDNSRASLACEGDGAVNCTVTDFTRVGSKPAGNGKWGHADMAGNVSEWVLDYAPADSASYLMPCTDCAFLTPNNIDLRVHRGGTFNDRAAGQEVRAARRSNYIASNHDLRLGIRCARAN